MRALGVQVLEDQAAVLSRGGTDIQLIGLKDLGFIPGSIPERRQEVTNTLRNVPLRSLVRGDRPRELEMLNYIFRVKGVSLACVTHFTRHRIQSLIVPAPYTALAENTYVLPASVKANPEALSLYTEAFAVNAAAARAYAARPELLGYFALAGCTVDIPRGEGLTLPLQPDIQRAPAGGHTRAVPFSKRAGLGHMGIFVEVLFLGLYPLLFQALPSKRDGRGDGHGQKSAFRQQYRREPGKDAGHPVPLFAPHRPEHGAPHR